MPEEQYMNERAIMAIIKALDGYEAPVGRDWPDQKKEKVIFAHWALDEILTQVWDHPWTPASDTIDEFAVTMTVYAATAVTEDQKRIFTVAAETAWELLDNVKVLEH